MTLRFFAKLDDNNTVETVIVIDSDNLLDENGKESETVGQAYIASIGLEGKYVQTFKNRTARGNLAGIGMIYDPIKDEFIDSIAVI